MDEVLAGQGLVMGVRKVLRDVTAEGGIPVSVLGGGGLYLEVAGSIVGWATKTVLWLHVNGVP